MRFDPQGEPVLRFESVVALPGAGALDFEICGGEVVLLETGKRMHVEDAGDVAIGMSPPHSGQVRFRGSRWSELEAGEADLARRRIGRVQGRPRRAIWLANLDIDENIHLARYFQKGASREKVLAEAKALGQRLGLDPLPPGRAVETSENDLRRAQWVRALLPEPLDLLILENPLRGASPAGIEAFCGEVARVREGETAVLWLETEADEDLEVSGLAIDQRIRAERD